MFLLPCCFRPLLGLNSDSRSKSVFSSRLTAHPLDDPLASDPLTAAVAPLLFPFDREEDEREGDGVDECEEEEVRRQLLSVAVPLLNADPLFESGTCWYPAELLPPPE